MLATQDPARAGHGDEDVAALGRLEGGHDLVTGHSRLERAQRIDLAHDHRRARPSGPLGDALACPSVPDHDQRVTGEQHIAGAHDPVQRRLARAVAVVERPLGTRLVDGEDGARELTGVLEPAQSHEARRRLFGAADQFRQRHPAGRVRAHEQVGAVVDRDLRRPREQGVDVLDVRVEILAMDRPDLDAVVGHERRRDVVLRGQRVRRAQGEDRATGLERADEVRRLGGDVQAGGHAEPGERALAFEPLADPAQHRHLCVRPFDPRFTRGGERDVGDRVAGAVRAAWGHLSSGSGPACRGLRPERRDTPPARV